MASIALTSGLKSLLSTQNVLDTIGNNIANANTPGYSRQRVSLAPAGSLRFGRLSIGTGVDALGIQRSVDTVLERRLVAQLSVSGRLGSLLGGLEEVESLFAAPDGLGVGQVLAGFFTSLGSLSTAPEDKVLRSSSLQAADQMASSLRQLAGGLSDSRLSVKSQIQGQVTKANVLAEGLAQLNGEIQKAKASGSDPNALLDQRGQMLAELAELVDVTALESSNGTLTVLTGGGVLVGQSKARALSVSGSPGGALTLALEGNPGTIDVKGGTIGGLLKLAEGFVPGVQDDLDQLARNLILEANRLHSTGVPPSGSFKELVGANALVDVDGDGFRSDEKLADAGLSFDVESGSLFVNTVDDATGDVRVHELAIDAQTTTVGGFISALQSIPGLSAEVDASGRLRVRSQPGVSFDFGARLDATPDAAGTFGGGKASLATGSGAPFALANGDALDLTVGATSFSIAFSAADFADIGAATADEVAAAINADAGAQANGIAATVVDGRVFLQTTTSGASAAFTVAGGSALGALGLAGFSGATISGSDDSVSVAISGKYTGSANQKLVFQPASDGTIGTTPGLLVDVFDASGQKLATLDVGAGYVPGTEIEVEGGIFVSFGLGELSATNGDRFTLDALADADTSDVLVALGLNSLFVGTGADDIAVRSDLLANPDRFATSGSGAAGDSGLLNQLLALETRELEGLGGATLGEHFGTLVGEVGFEVSATRSARNANEALLTSLKLRRDQISGVNVDEELVDLLRFEQAFGAAAQFLQVINQVNDDILSLV